MYKEKGSMVYILQEDIRQGDRMFELKCRRFIPILIPFLVLEKEKRERKSVALGFQREKVWKARDMSHAALSDCKPAPMGYLLITIIYNYHK